MEKGFIKGLAHIGIFVKDMEASKDYYVKLGFSLDKEAKLDDLELAFLSAGTCLIELVKLKDYVERPAGVIDHIAVEVDDIDAAVANATAKGINIDASAVTFVQLLGGIKNVFFEGPDGERIEYFEYC